MEMKTQCEKCDMELQQDGVAYICSYECTYCEECTKQMDNVCPNCSGELVRRPKRTKKENE
ncbi:MAG: DUF1272 domain-containing protein [Chitinophagaceae bacterium]|nr:DUF1272 domain-containing protein [Chitinophagaceae bacterium]